MKRHAPLALISDVHPRSSSSTSSGLTSVRAQASVQVGFWGGGGGASACLPAFLEAGEPSLERKTREKKGMAPREPPESASQGGGGGESTGKQEE